MPLPITVISATGKGCAISASNSAAKAPVMTVPSFERSPCAWLITLTSDVFGFILQGFTVNKFGS